MSGFCGVAKTQRAGNRHPTVGHEKDKKGTIWHGHGLSVCTRF
jgi:hypothetical protein